MFWQCLALMEIPDDFSFILAFQWPPKRLILLMNDDVNRICCNGKEKHTPTHKLNKTRVSFNIDQEEFTVYSEN